MSIREFEKMVNIRISMAEYGKIQDILSPKYDLTQGTILSIAVLIRNGEFQNDWTMSSNLKQSRMTEQFVFILNKINTINIVGYCPCYVAHFWATATQ